MNFGNSEPPYFAPPCPCTCTCNCALVPSHVQSHAIITFAPPSLHALVPPCFRAFMLLGLCACTGPVSSASAPPRSCHTALLRIRARKLPCHLPFPSAKLPCFSISPLSCIRHHGLSSSAVLQSSLFLLIGSPRLRSRIITILSNQNVRPFSSRTTPPLLSSNALSSTSPVFSISHKSKYRNFNSNTPAFRSAVL